MDSLLATSILIQRVLIMSLIKRMATGFMEEQRPVIQLYIQMSGGKHGTGFQVRLPKEAWP